MYRIGIDVGGTFTDLAAIDAAGKVTIAKSPSTPADHSVGVLNGLELLAGEMGLDRAALLARTDQIVHGTTVATNALLERRGAKVGLLTTMGHRDVIEQREGYKPGRYDLRLPHQPALVPRHLRRGVKERMRFDGSIQVPLDEDSLCQEVEALRGHGVDAVAICFLHAHTNQAHERAAVEIVRRMMPDAYVSVSSDIIREIKEYERFSTTVINAFVGKKLKAYLDRLDQALRAKGYSSGILVMHSHGGVATIEDSARLAAGCVLSGPAGGIAAAAYISALTGEKNLVSFDMGGTSTDIAIIEDGRVPLTTDRDIDELRIALPSIDIHTIGSGGGSVASVDIGGFLHVGPESAGADPGPACYGKGGHRATVTDANAATGCFDAQSFMGGRLELDEPAARSAIAEIAAALGCEAGEAAQGIQRLVNTQMAEGVRVMSVRRGIDLRDFTLLSFGGAAGLHVADVARMLDVKRVLVPNVASVLSAWGMLTSDLRYELSRSHLTSLSAADPSLLRKAFGELAADGRRRLDGLKVGQVDIEYAADLRYGEQVFELNVPLTDVDFESEGLIGEIVERFHRRHEEVYTFRSEGQEVVLVNLRVSVIGRQEGIKPGGEPRSKKPASASPRRRRIYDEGWRDVALHAFEDIAVGQIVEGPALVEARTTTVALRKGDRARLNALGWLDITIGTPEAVVAVEEKHAAPVA